MKRAEQLGSRHLCAMVTASISSILLVATGATGANTASGSHADSVAVDVVVVVVAVASSVTSTRTGVSDHVHQTQDDEGRRDSSDDWKQKSTVVAVVIVARRSNSRAVSCSNKRQTHVVTSGCSWAGTTFRKTTTDPDVTSPMKIRLVIF